MDTKQIANSNLQLFKKILDVLNIVFILDGGTCLGAYRDKDFCQDDETDIDLTTYDSYSNLIDNIIEKSLQKGFVLYHRWDNLAIDSNKYTKQISFKKDNIKIDLMFKKFKDDWAWWTVFKGDKVAKYKKVPAKFYLKLQSIEFKGDNYLIPHDIEEYLTYRYGNWIKPVHRKDYSCYSTDKAIINGYEEI